MGLAHSESITFMKDMIKNASIHNLLEFYDIDEMFEWLESCTDFYITYITIYSEGSAAMGVDGSIAQLIILIF